MINLKEKANLPTLLFDKKLIRTKSTHYSVVQSQFDKLPDCFEMVTINTSLLPYVICSKCAQFFFLYKIDGGKIKANSLTNLIKHTNNCIKVVKTPQVSIRNFAAAPMPDSMRENLSRYIAEYISKSPTLSIQAATDFANNLLSSITPDILNNGNQFNYNVSRQLVATKIRDIGEKRKKLNIKKFNENIWFSSLTFDHWTAHGTNFFCAIATTTTPDYDRDQYCVKFKVASKDKTSNGYINDFESLFANKNLNFQVPMMTDNCYTMVKAGRISKLSKKIYCFAHLLNKINEDLHNLPAIKKLDSDIKDINSFFNYRHSAYDLPLKPIATYSETRSWRSNNRNYKITLRNFDQ